MSRERRDRIESIFEAALEGGDASSDSFCYG